MKNIIIEDPEFRAEKLKRKYIGCMLGAAIGDALGKQNEGCSREAVLKAGRISVYGRAPEGCPGEKLRAGQYTDDTEQMLVLAGSIIDRSGFDIIDFSERIAKWGADAMADPVKKNLVGPSSAQSILRLNSGISWKGSGSDIPTCGSAMRAAPIGLFYESLDEIESFAALSSIPTHKSPGSQAGAVAAAIGVRCALNEVTACELIRETVMMASKYDVLMGEKIKIAFNKKDNRPDEVFNELGTSYSVYETVPSAFYCFSRHIESPEMAIIEAVNAGGDTDSIACITGALCGALHGQSCFPEKWIAGLENKDILIRTAILLFEASVKK
ncbi:MAG: ADP-ribosylglycohydrolase family protein [Candidatus Methanoperedens sp.]|nr:ADP-ribosylglycohydrolase family protein [Candidatus Methanoperedens sp.]MCE8425126.1 ADP-ribosylglycohydrolase family protein [Candidatus Methanoperedens sp.]MCE8428305.1 ADP-ribosylglycohydrolase family protein [Candidatus Methanoperedens sp.]